ncbi:MAG TPA: tetratricopeptide repeat protein [Ktedonobacteraceae bacterium]|nr:tetratricopeptide repeat protein [Ktedonobacteraceae bacterium]
MDAVQFGRWVSERRRTLGWNSQRALVDAVHALQNVHNEAHVSSSNISEDFLARLEAGHLAHPFRGTVRQRVLALAELLCKNPQEVRAYVRAAEISELSAEESEQVQSLKDALTPPQTPPILFLPPRPQRFVGRGAELQELSQLLSSAKADVYAITGMPGIGKSTLAYEVVHQLAANERERKRLFPNGIVMFTCTGRRGIEGLISLLHEITALFQSAPSRSGNVKTAGQVRAVRATGPLRTMPHGAMQRYERNELQVYTYNSELAQAVNSVRTALFQQRVLLLLDDVDAEFPLREALNALVAHSVIGSVSHSNENFNERRVVLLTSRCIPPPALVTHHLHLAPLKPAAANDLLAQLVGQSVVEEERTSVEQICAAVGYLPRAIEVAADAIRTRRIPLPLLAERVARYPLDLLLDGDGEIHTILSQSLEGLARTTQERYALLSILGMPSFELEHAAALHMSEFNALETTAWDDADQESDQSDQNDQANYIEQQEADKKRGMPLSHLSYFFQPQVIADNAAPQEEVLESVVISSEQLAYTAADLGLFVQRSLLEFTHEQVEHTIGLRLAVPVEYGSNQAVVGMNGERSTHYSIHPLLRATALERLRYLDPTKVDNAQHNMQQYALDLLERYGSDIHRLEREREFLLASLKRAWYLEQYDVVIRIVAGLSCLIGRLDTGNDGIRILLWGIHASSQRSDRYHQADFLSHLGTLFCYRGELAFARRALEESLEIADELGNYAHLAQPLCNLAHIAHLLDDYEAAQRFADDYLQRMQQFGDPGRLPNAFYVHGFYARLQGEKDIASEDLHSSLRLFSAQNVQNPHDTSYYEHIFELDVRAELARVQDDIFRSQEYVESAIAIVKDICDPYGIVDRLYDQAFFAYQLNALHEAAALAQRAIDVATRINSPHIRMRSMRLLQWITETM